MSHMKSPLKDPHDFKSGRLIAQMISPESPIRSYMLFSGQIEFSLMKAGFKVKALTNKPAIFDFWKHALQRPTTVAAHALGMHEHTVSPDVVLSYQQDWTTYREPYMRAAIFYLLNRYSYTGQIAHGDFDIDNFNAFSVETLKKLYNAKDSLTVHYYPETYAESGIKYSKPDEILLFPAGTYLPRLLLKGLNEGHDQYAIQHDVLKRRIEESGNKFIICYKYHPHLRQLYGEHSLVYVNQHGNEIAQARNAEEVIISNL